jgi:cellulose synthase/poly-beta-1,6-N-acetylglucosamine synthase-like glycosyltransferase
MTLLVIITGSLYFMIIGLFFWGWIKTPVLDKITTNPTLKVSIIIPFRNERSNIENCLLAISKQNYPKEYTEIIAVNDHSTDNSLTLIRSLNITSLTIHDLPINNTGKKAAMLLGTQSATGDIIITTDADVIPDVNWISSIVAFYQKHPYKMIVAPVMLSFSQSLFSKFQALEFISLQGSTAGAIGISSPIMCNGANLIFSNDCLPLIQETYQKNSFASGDDIFALLAVKNKFPGEVAYLKSQTATVITAPANDLKSFLNQRRRWAAKAPGYTDFFLILTTLLVLSTNLLLLTLLLTNNLKLFIYLLIFKSAIDFPFLYHVSTFFKAKKLMKWFSVFQSFYFLYISLTFVSTIFGKNTWKSRKIRA